MPLGAPGGWGLVAWEQTLGDLLSAAGYGCAVYGKWHVGEGPGRWPTDKGFEEWYGPPRTYVRAIYEGTSGWFSGDATELAAPLHAERARRHVDALGGRDAVLDKARAARQAGDYGWAAGLLTRLIRTDATDTEARKAKADALRQWGYLQKNIYWRSMAIGGANELDDAIDYSQTYEFQPPDVLNAIPAVSRAAPSGVRWRRSTARGSRGSGAGSG